MTLADEKRVLNDDTARAHVDIVLLHLLVIDLQTLRRLLRHPTEGRYTLCDARRMLPQPKQGIRNNQLINSIVGTTVSQVLTFENDVSISNPRLGHGTSTNRLSGRERRKLP